MSLTVFCARLMIMVGFKSLESTDDKPGKCSFSKETSIDSITGVQLFNYPWIRKRQVGLFCDVISTLRKEEIDGGILSNMFTGTPQGEATKTWLISLFLKRYTKNRAKPTTRKISNF